MSSRNEDTLNKKERRRRVQLEENVFTTQISHYHQTMGYYSGVGPPFMPDRNCYNNINWSSRAPPWTGWTPPPPGAWMTSVGNGAMVPTPQSFPCRVPNRVPPSPFNPPVMPPQPTPVIDPLLGPMHTPASNNLRGWYARYPNDIPIQELPMVVPSGQLDNIECLRHVGNHIRADHNFVEKTLVQKCETTASVCGTTVTRRSWYKMPEKSPPQTIKEKPIKTSEKKDNINIVESAVLPTKVKKMEDAVILSSDYCSKLAAANSSSKSSNCLPEVPNHNTSSSSNFTEYFLKRLMKKHQKESNMKKITVSDPRTSDTQSAIIQGPKEVPEKRASRVPICKNHIPKSHASKMSKRIIEDVIDLSRDSPPTVSEPNKNGHQNEAASCDLVITNSYSLSFSGVSNKTANPSSLTGARLPPTKRKLPDTKPLTHGDNQKENLIVSDSINDFQMKLTEGRSKRKKYEPRKRDSFTIEDDTSCWVSGTMNKLIDSNFHSNDKNVLTRNVIEKTIPSVQSNKIDSDNAPEYCDIVDILHSLSESGPNSQGVHASNKESLLPKKDSILERKIIRTTNSIRNDKCITLDDTDDSDGTQSGETLTPCTVIRSRQSLDTLSTADNSVDSLHDSTISSSSLDNNDVVEEGAPEKKITFSPMTVKDHSKDQDGRNSTTSENILRKENISSLTKQKDDNKQLSLEISSNKEVKKSTSMTVSLIKPPVCKLPKAILPIKKQPIENRISDEELETLESLGTKASGENVTVTTSSSCLRKEAGSQNKDEPQNDVIIMLDTHASVESEKIPVEKSRPTNVSSENSIAIVNDRLENSEEAPSVGNESDDSLLIGRSPSESPLPEGIGSYHKMAEKDGKETAITTTAAAKASLIDQNTADLNIAKIKQIWDSSLKVNSLADESDPKCKTAAKANDLCDDQPLEENPSLCNASNDREMMPSKVVESLESQKEQQKQTTAPQWQEINSSSSSSSSLTDSMLHKEQTKKSLLSKSSNIFTLTTSLLKNKSTTSLTDCNETVPTPTLQQPGLEILNLSKKVPSCNNLKEIDQTPCLEISENGDMKVIAIVTDYEESACDNLLRLTDTDGMMGKNSSVIVTSIDSSKKDSLLEYSEHTNISPCKEFHKSKLVSLAEIDKCKNAKGNGSLFSSLLNCHKEKDLFSKNINGDIAVLNDPTPKEKQHTLFSSQSVRSSSGIDDQVVHFEPPNSAIGLNIMSVELKQPSSTMDYSAEKFAVPLVSSLVDKCENKSNSGTAINNHSLENQDKSPKQPKVENKKNNNSSKPKNKIKIKNFLKNFKKQKISPEMRHSKKMYRQFKKKYMSFGMRIDREKFQEPLAPPTNKKEDTEPITDTNKDDKVTLQVASEVSPQTSLAKNESNILWTRFSSSCPDRRGRIFRSPLQEAVQGKDDRERSLDKQCQTDNPFYGCLTHAFHGSCYRQTARRPSPPIIHKFVKFHGHKLLCVIINVKKYVIVRELVQKCFQGKNQVIFYRTKYRDYSFPYLELPFHMKSFVLKYLLESETLLTGNRATPMGIMLLSDAEIIYHFFYSFRECSLSACIQDWDPDDRGVYDQDWLKVLDVAPTVSTKTESLDSASETGLPTNYLCTCNQASNNFAAVLGPCRTVARQPVKRPMSGIFEPSFQSPIFGTTNSSSTQTSPLDIITSMLPEPEDEVSTKLIKRDNNLDPTLDSSRSTISLEESLLYSNPLLALSTSDLVSASSDYCDFVSRPISADFVSEAHRNNDDDDDDDDNSCGSDPQTSSQFSSDLPLEEPSKGNNHEPHFPLSDSAQTHEFVLGGMTLLEGKIVRFVELGGQRHFLLIDIDSSWTLTGILDRLLESEIVVQKCSPSQRSFLLNLNRTLPQANADDMLLIADKLFPRLKTCLTLTPFNSSCHTPHMVHSKPDPEPLTPEQQTHCPSESQSEQNYLFTEMQR